MTRNGTFYSRSYKAWKLQTTRLLATWWKGKPPLTGVAIAVTLHGKHARRGDADNLLKSVLDALVGAGVLLRDNLNGVPKASLELRYDPKLPPRWVLQINSITTSDA